MSNALTYDLTDYLIAPHQIALDLTNKCNLRCLHCYNYSGDNNIVPYELSDDEVLEFVETVIPLHPYNFCMCGGEPLLRKDLLIACAKLLSKQGTIVSMVSNGILASHNVLDELYEAGVRNIQYSLDGLKKGHERLRNKKGIFERVLDAIIYTAQLNITLSIAFCPTSFNLDEFTMVYDLLMDLSKKYRPDNPIKLRVQPLMELGRASENLNEIMPTEEQYRALIREIALRENTMVKIDWGDPIDHLIRFSNKSLPLNFCTIRANGDLSVSPYLPLVVGNIKRHTLEEYWNGGMNRIWERKIVRYLASYLRAIPDMYTISDYLPETFKDTEISLDLLECNLDDMSLLDSYI